MREVFLSFFEKKGHERTKPYPVVSGGGTTFTLLLPALLIFSLTLQTGSYRRLQILL